MTLGTRSYKFRDYSRSSLQRKQNGDTADSLKPDAPKNRTLKVDWMIHEQDGQFRDLLVAMRRKSGLTIAAVARRLNVDRSSIKKYYDRKRGKKASSRLSWFMRYAEATGCKVYVVFPTDTEARQLDPHGSVSTPPLRGVEGA